MKHNPKITVIALVLGLLTLMVGSGAAFVVLQERGSIAPALSTTSVATVPVTTTQMGVPAAVQPEEQITVDEPAQSTTPILPAVTTVGAEEDAQLESLLGSGLKLITPNHTYEVSRGELGSWIDGVTWSDAMIRKKIRGMAREQDRAAVPTKVIGSTDQVVEQGTQGLIINQDEAYRVLVTALTSGLPERELVIPTTVTEPGREAVSPNAAPTLTTGKQIVLVLSEQRTYAWNNGRLEASFLISSGLTGPTPTGDFAIWSRIPVGCMSGPGYSLCDIHWIQYFTAAGHGFHEAWWHNNFGNPMSHGCVNMTYEDSKWLYEWSDYGTPVHIVE